ncbi:methyltransferase domain-containing protein [Paenibacillus naphthalenovorans]|uniref:methyltransferase domain-containing protein n=2 Tax=Paenibacillus TaxID=44249 RepID=UPI00088AA6C1|nr:methyltransferase domain-containing protein [Paenibacillus naphthalenovorans]GCL73497.1 methyltransferase domain-containing protein [Paenibacillus naphthalenovorans]SDJ38566.1 2-polyprenyl-3-methyl-5-hydroxy-6-metoxy-1,4-benzoquinol methylase [Paenibacillus naphthalenovorans]
MKRLKQRATEPELMDDFSQGGPELCEALRHLRRLNRILGASAPTLYGIRRLWTEADKPERLSILDIGSGSGDINRKVLRWADTNRIQLKITLVDITEEACEEARMYYRGEPRVQVLHGDVFKLPEACADLVTGTQFVHHFASDELPEVVRSMLKASRIGVVINDIHRHWLPWAAVWITARLVSRNRYIVNDGPLSVAKGFRPADWDHLGKALGASELFYAWRPLFRYAAVIRKDRVQFNRRS